MIVVLFADGFEEIEALTPVDILRRAGFRVITVGITGKIVEGAHKIKYETDCLFSELPQEKIELLILPGGMPGAKNLDESEFTDRIIEQTISDGGRIGAICAAPFILGKRDLLNGKRACCYPGFESYLKGATVVSDGVVTDGIFTTAKGMGVALDFSLELLSLLKGKDSAISMAKSIMKN